MYADTETAQAERLGEGLAHRAGVLRGLIQDPANGLRGIPLLRTRVNRSVRLRTAAAEKIQIHREFIALCLNKDGREKQ